jgi:hypothetical protein
VPLDPRCEAVLLPADPPRRAVLALWGEHAAPTDATIELVLAAGQQVRRRTVPARLLPLADALPALLTIDPDLASPSVRVWSAAAAAAVDLVARGRLLPGASADGRDAWRAGPLDPDAALLLRALAAALPPQAHAVPIPGSRPLRVTSPEAAVRLLYDAVADTLVRTAAAARTTASPLFAAVEPMPVGPLAGWLAETGEGLRAASMTGLRVSTPDDEDVPFSAVLQLRSTADPSLVVDAADLWAAPAAVLARLGPDAETDLLLALRRGAKAWPPLGAALRQAAPASVELSVDEVADLLTEGAAALGGAGLEVLWPTALLDDGLRLRASASATAAPAAVTAAGLDLETLLHVQLTATLDGAPLTKDELSELSEAKRPLVRMRGRWVRVDGDLLTRLRRRRPASMSVAAGLAAALTGTVELDGVRVEFEPTGPLAQLAARLRAGSDSPRTLAEPPGLEADLRDYQRRGLAWLAQMCELGVGGCLADDMGLGKTIQVIALHLHLQQRAAVSGPTLVVCPTSLLGNWERELHRFAPDVPVRRYHEGKRSLDDVATREVVLTTYGVVRRARPALANVAWGLVVADEAQAVKNPLSRTARELRALPAGARIALSGTPVENRLSDLWALLDWTTPGLLGPLEVFRRTVAVPVERHRDPETTERLGRLVRPFLLRRKKSDPGIAPELPAKTETDRIVPLTPEQATLYGAVVEETLAQIAAAEGIQRRGLVLKLITSLKQVCNHPAQYLGEPAPLAGRSGKLDALDALLDVVLSEGASTLVFSQYVGMARLLETHLQARGIATRFLHGGVPAARRQALVADFEAGAAPVFLLSLKAGGTGLNLTRATHVVHYDRWWNPAVEDQATDRAYRIGQDRPVQVHRLITEGTLEDRIAALLTSKRALADAVVGSGEGWVSELADDELAALVRLS